SSIHWLLTEWSRSTATRPSSVSTIPMPSKRSLSATFTTSSNVAQVVESSALANRPLGWYGGLVHFPERHAHLHKTKRAMAWSSSGRILSRNALMRGSSVLGLSGLTMLELTAGPRHRAVRASRRASHLDGLGPWRLDLGRAAATWRPQRRA